MSLQSDKIRYIIEHSLQKITKLTMKDKVKAKFLERRRINKIKDAMDRLKTVLGIPLSEKVTQKVLLETASARIRELMRILEEDRQVRSHTEEQTTPS